MQVRVIARIDNYIREPITLCWVTARRPFYCTFTCICVLRINYFCAK